jgi:hypothetical protein
MVSTSVGNATDRTEQESLPEIKSRTRTSNGGVKMWRGGLGSAYPLPTLSAVGASLFPPCFRFHTPLIEPHVRMCRIRLSEKTHAIAVAIACDVVCDF